MDLEWLEELLDGIDRTDAEYDEGWWETSTGATFGAKKLAELRAEIERRYGDDDARRAAIREEIEATYRAQLSFPWVVE